MSNCCGLKCRVVDPSEAKTWREKLEQIDQAKDGTAADISQEGNGSVSDNITGNIKSNKKLAAGCQENPFSKNIIALPRKCFRVPASQQQVCYDKNSFKQQ